MSSSDSSGDDIFFNVSQLRKYLGRRSEHRRNAKTPNGSPASSTQTHVHDSRGKEYLGSSGNGSRLGSNRTTSEASATRVLSQGSVTERRDRAEKLSPGAWRLAAAENSTVRAGSSSDDDDDRLHLKASLVAKALRQRRSEVALPTGLNGRRKLSMEETVTHALYDTWDQHLPLVAASSSSRAPSQASVSAVKPHPAQPASFLHMHMAASGHDRLAKFAAASAHAPHSVSPASSSSQPLPVAPSPVVSTSRGSPEQMDSFNHIERRHQLAGVTELRQRIMQSATSRAPRGRNRRVSPPLEAAVASSLTSSTDAPSSANVPVQESWSPPPPTTGPVMQASSDTNLFEEKRLGRDWRETQIATSSGGSPTSCGKPGYVGNQSDRELSPEAYEGARHVRSSPARLHKPRGGPVTATLRVSGGTAAVVAASLYGDQVEPPVVTSGSSPRPVSPSGGGARGEQPLSMSTAWTDATCGVGQDLDAGLREFDGSVQTSDVGGAVAPAVPVVPHAVKAAGTVSPPRQIKVSDVLPPSHDTSPRPQFAEALHGATSTSGGRRQAFYSDGGYPHSTVAVQDTVAPAPTERDAPSSSGDRPTHPRPWDTTSILPGAAESVKSVSVSQRIESNGAAMLHSWSGRLETSGTATATQIEPITLPLDIKIAGASQRHQHGIPAHTHGDWPDPATSSQMRPGSADIACLGNTAQQSALSRTSTHHGATAVRVESPASPRQGSDSVGWMECYDVSSVSSTGVEDVPGGIGRMQSGAVQHALSSQRPPENVNQEGLLAVRVNASLNASSSVHVTESLQSGANAHSNRDDPRSWSSVGSVPYLSERPVTTLGLAASAPPTERDMPQSISGGDIPPTARDQVDARTPLPDTRTLLQAMRSEVGFHPAPVPDVPPAEARGRIREPSPDPMPCLPAERQQPHGEDSPVLLQQSDDEPRGTRSGDSVDAGADGGRRRRSVVPRLDLPTLAPGPPSSAASASHELPVGHTLISGSSVSSVGEEAARPVRLERKGTAAMLALLQGFGGIPRPRRESRYVRSPNVPSMSPAGALAELAGDASGRLGGQSSLSLGTSRSGNSEDEGTSHEANASSASNEAGWRRERVPSFSFLTDVGQQKQPPVKRVSKSPGTSSSLLSCVDVRPWSPLVGGRPDAEYGPHVDGPCAAGGQERSPQGGLDAVARDGAEMRWKFAGLESASRSRASSPGISSRPEINSITQELDDLMRRVQAMSHDRDRKPPTPPSPPMGNSPEHGRPSLRDGLGPGPTELRTEMAPSGLGGVGVHVNCDVAAAAVSSPRVDVGSPSANGNGCMAADCMSPPGRRSPSPTAQAPKRAPDYIEAALRQLSVLQREVDQVRRDGLLDRVTRSAITALGSAKLAGPAPRCGSHSTTATRAPSLPMGPQHARQTPSAASPPTQPSPRAAPVSAATTVRSSVAPLRTTLSLGDDAGRPRSPSPRALSPLHALLPVDEAGRTRLPSPRQLSPLHALRPLYPPAPQSAQSGLTGSPLERLELLSRPGMFSITTPTRQVASAQRAAASDAAGMYSGFGRRARSAPRRYGSPKPIRPGRSGRYLAPASSGAGCGIAGSSAMGGVRTSRSISVGGAQWPWRTEHQGQPGFLGDVLRECSGERNTSRSRNVSVGGLESPPFFLSWGQRREGGSDLAARRQIPGANPTERAGLSQLPSPAQERLALAEVAAIAAGCGPHPPESPRPSTPTASPSVVRTLWLSPVAATSPRHGAGSAQSPVTPRACSPAALAGLGFGATGSGSLDTAPSSAGPSTASTFMRNMLRGMSFQVAAGPSPRRSPRTSPSQAPLPSQAGSSHVPDGARYLAAIAAARVPVRNLTSTGISSPRAMTAEIEAIRRCLRDIEQPPQSKPAFRERTPDPLRGAGNPSWGAPDSGKPERRRPMTASPRTSPAQLRSPRSHGSAQAAGTPSRRTADVVFAATSAVQSQPPSRSPSTSARPWNAQSSPRDTAAMATAAGSLGAPVYSSSSPCMANTDRYASPPLPSAHRTAQAAISAAQHGRNPRQVSPMAAAGRAVVATAPLSVGLRKSLEELLKGLASVPISNTPSYGRPAVRATSPKGQQPREAASRRSPLLLTRTTETGRTSVPIGVSMRQYPSGGAAGGGQGAGAVSVTIIGGAAGRPLRPLSTAEVLSFLSDGNNTSRTSPRGGGGGGLTPRTAASRSKEPQAGHWKPPTSRDAVSIADGSPSAEKAPRNSQAAPSGQAAAHRAPDHSLLRILQQLRPNPLRRRNIANPCQRESQGREKESCVGSQPCSSAIGTATSRHSGQAGGATGLGKAVNVGRGNGAEGGGASSQGLGLKARDGQSLSLSPPQQQQQQQTTPGRLPSRNWLRLIQKPRPELQIRSPALQAPREAEQTPLLSGPAPAAYVVSQQATKTQKQSDPAPQPLTQLPHHASDRPEVPRAQLECTSSEAQQQQTLEAQPAQRAVRKLELPQILQRGLQPRPQPELILARQATLQDCTHETETHTSPGLAPAQIKQQTVVVPPQVNRPLSQLKEAKLRQGLQSPESQKPQQLASEETSAVNAPAVSEVQQQPPEARPVAGARRISGLQLSQLMGIFAQYRKNADNGAKDAAAPPVKECVSGPNCGGPSNESHLPVAVAIEAPSQPNKSSATLPSTIASVPSSGPSAALGDLGGCQDDAAGGAASSSSVESPRAVIAYAAYALISCPAASSRVPLDNSASSRLCVINNKLSVETEPLTATIPRCAQGEELEAVSKPPTPTGPSGIRLRTDRMATVSSSPPRKAYYDAASCQASSKQHSITDGHALREISASTAVSAEAGLEYRGETELGTRGRHGEGGPTVVEVYSTACRSTAPTDVGRQPDRKDCAAAASVSATPGSQSPGASRCVTSQYEGQSQSRGYDRPLALRLQPTADKSQISDTAASLGEAVHDPAAGLACVVSLADLSKTIQGLAHIVPQQKGHDSKPQTSREHAAAPASAAGAARLPMHMPLNTTASSSRTRDPFLHAPHPADSPNVAEPECREACSMGTGVQYQSLSDCVRIAASLRMALQPGRSSNHTAQRSELGLLRQQSGSTAAGEQSVGMHFASRPRVCSGLDGMPYEKPTAPPPKVADAVSGPMHTPRDEVQARGANAGDGCGSPFASAEACAVVVASTALCTESPQALYVAGAPPSSTSCGVQGPLRLSGQMWQQQQVSAGSSGGPTETYTAFAKGSIIRALSHSCSDGHAAQPFDERRTADSGGATGSSAGDGGLYGSTGTAQLDMVAHVPGHAEVRVPDTSVREVHLPASDRDRAKTPVTAAARVEEPSLRQGLGMLPALPLLPNVRSDVGALAPHVTESPSQEHHSAALRRYTEGAGPDSKCKAGQQGGGGVSYAVRAGAGTELTASREVPAPEPDVSPDICRRKLSRESPHRHYLRIDFVGERNTHTHSTFGSGGTVSGGYDEALGVGAGDVCREPTETPSDSSTATAVTPHGSRPDDNNRVAASFVACLFSTPHMQRQTAPPGQLHSPDGGDGTQTPPCISDSSPQVGRSERSPRGFPSSWPQPALDGATPQSGLDPIPQRPVAPDLSELQQTPATEVHSRCAPNSMRPSASVTRYAALDDSPESPPRQRRSSLCGKRGAAGDRKEHVTVEETAGSAAGDGRSSAGCRFDSSGEDTSSGVVLAASTHLADSACASNYNAGVINGALGLQDGGGGDGTVFVSLISGGHRTNAMLEMTPLSLPVTPAAKRWASSQCDSGAPTRVLDALRQVPTLLQPALGHNAPEKGPALAAAVAADHKGLEPPQQGPSAAPGVPVQDKEGPGDHGAWQQHCESAASQPRSSCLTGGGQSPLLPSEEYLTDAAGSGLTAQAPLTSRQRNQLLGPRPQHRRQYALLHPEAALSQPLHRGLPAPSLAAPSISVETSVLQHHVSQERSMLPQAEMRPTQQGPAAVSLPPVYVTDAGVLAPARLSSTLLGPVDCGDGGYEEDTSSSAYGAESVQDSGTAGDQTQHAGRACFSGQQTGPINAYFGQAHDVNTSHGIANSWRQAEGQKQRQGSRMPGVRLGKEDVQHSLGKEDYNVTGSTRASQPWQQHHQLGQLSGHGRVQGVVAAGAESGWDPTGTHTAMRSRGGGAGEQLHVTGVREVSSNLLASLRQLNKETQHTCARMLQLYYAEGGRH